MPAAAGFQVGRKGWKKGWIAKAQSFSLRSQGVEFHIRHPNPWVVYCRDEPPNTWL